jgi:hypothetical protein
MERLFIDFLGDLQPKPQYLRLFGEIIIDVWKQKQAQATSIHEAAKRAGLHPRARASAHASATRVRSTLQLPRGPGQERTGPLFGSLHWRTGGGTDVRLATAAP